MLKTAFNFIKKVILVVWLIAMLVVGAWFASENPNKVTPLLFGYALPQLSLGIYLSVTLIVGVVIGGTLSFLGTQSKMIKVKRACRTLDKEVKRLEADNVKE